jgi:hypothetical protein
MMIVIMRNEIVLRMDLDTVDETVCLLISVKSVSRPPSTIDQITTRWREKERERVRDAKEHTVSIPYCNSLHPSLKLHT